MPTLRIIGGIAAFAFFLFQIRRYTRREVSRLNLIISCLLCITVIALAVSPSLFNPVFRTFNFQPPVNRTDAEARNRLVFVLVVAVVILFALNLRLQSSADTNERSIRLLIEALGQERSTGTGRPRSPPVPASSRSRRPTTRRRTSPR